MGSPSYQDDDGWWSKVTNEDRAAAMAKLAEEAKVEAKRSGILRQAEEMTGSRLTELAGQRSIRLRLQAPAE